MVRYSHKKNHVNYKPVYFSLFSESKKRKLLDKSKKFKIDN